MLWTKVKCPPPPKFRSLTCFSHQSALLPGAFSGVPESVIGQRERRSRPAAVTLSTQRHIRFASLHVEH